MHQLKDTKVNFVVISKPRVALTNIRFDDFRVEIQYLLNKHVDIVVDDFPNDLPPIRSISHHIDLILGSSFPNKVAYIMTPKENEEIINQV